MTSPAAVLSQKHGACQGGNQGSLAVRGPARGVPTARRSGSVIPWVPVRRLACRVPLSCGTVPQKPTGTIIIAPGLPESLRKLIAALALGALAALIVLVLHGAGALETAEMKAYDWRMRLRPTPSPHLHDIVLVEITDASIRDLSQIFGHWPWPRVAFSSALDFLRRAPAKVVAIDLIFAEPDTVAQYDLGGEKMTGAESDRALADSVKASGNVVLLADAVNEGLVGGHDITAQRGLARSRVSTWLRRRGPAGHPRAAPAAHRRGRGARPQLPGARRRRAGAADAAVRTARRCVFFRRSASPRRCGGRLPARTTSSLEGDAIRVRDRRIPLVPLPVDDSAGSTTARTISWRC